VVVERNRSSGREEKRRILDEFAAMKGGLDRQTGGES
jgi:hypothetical protein